MLDANAARTFVQPRLNAAPAGKAAAILLTLLLAGCSDMQSIHDSPDFYRHSYSQLSKPLDGGDFYWFDVKLTPEYPADSEAAEAIRMDWLSAWLETRKTCVNGYEIVEKRAFDFLEHNPAQYDLRYKVRCAVPSPSPAG
jgi:hypothetical protein